MYHPLTTCLRQILPAPRALAIVSLMAGCAPSDFDALERAREGEEQACDADAGALAETHCPRDPGEEDDEDDEDVNIDGGARRDGGEKIEPDAARARESEADASAQEVEDARSDPDGQDPADMGGAPGDAGTEADACDACGDTEPARCGGQPPVCSAGRPEMERRACGSCGAGVQVRMRSCDEDGCGWGAWSAWSACAAAETECEPGQVDTQNEACGACSAGSHTRSRTCSSDTCSWGEWSAWSACAEPASECSAGQVDTQSEACGACNTGTRTRTRACSSATCSWEEWGAWSGCGGVTAACSPGATMPCDPADSCGHRVCSNSCTWGGCVPAVANGCLRRRGGTQVEGSNYRCCGAGRWQFCLPSCEWSSDCAACSAQNCEC